jgi:hypothetical protein
LMSKKWFIVQNHSFLSFWFTETNFSTTKHQGP